MADPLAIPRTSGTEGPDLLPLAPFLASLASDGIRPTLRDYERIHMVLRTRGSWTVGRLRSVLSALLVRDPEQELVFRRRFESFFNPTVAANVELSLLDLEKILANLRALERMPELTKGPETMPRLQWWRVLQSELKRLFSRRIARYAYINDYETAGQEPDRAKEPVDEKPVDVEAIDEEPVDEALLFNVEGPRLFRAGKVGGLPAPRLDREPLDRLADCLGYFRSEEPSSDLDVPRSIKATGRCGGIPHLVFELHKRVRSVVILEDSLAEPRLWNPIAGELAEGLGSRGVPVVHGRFRGVPERFRTADGCEHEIEDLEDDRRGYLLFVFSDGKGLHHERDSFVLEALSRWPMMAWMELRERRAWDESTALPARFGLPVYPASRQGLLQVLGRFASERSSREDCSRGWETWCGVPAGGSGAQIQEHDLERLLGASLPWAQSCAMMVPPVSLGLADALRRRFHGDLPPERIERLVTLPGVFHNAAGLRFSRHVSELLRNGFLVRTTPEDQRHVLEFLIGELSKAEPEAKESLKHQAWEWRLEQLRLRLDPEPAQRRLAELMGGPLGDAIRAELPDPDEIAPPPPEWTNEKDGSVLVYVPAGTYTLGPDDITEDEKPIHRVQLSAFRIGKYPVTNEQYARFLAANSGQQKSEYWIDDRFNQPKQPVVGVSWEDADAYCCWAGLALPSEAQWEAAARGKDQRRYPWGNAKPSARHANYGRAVGKTTPVGAYPEGRGPFGTLDQAGNVFEWCADVWDPKASEGRDGQLDPVSTKGEAAFRVLRGGSWVLQHWHLAAAYRRGYWAGVRLWSFGFRGLLHVRPEH